MQLNNRHFVALQISVYKHVYKSLDMLQ